MPQFSQWVISHKVVQALLARRVTVSHVVGEILTRQRCEVEKNHALVWKRGEVGKAKQTKTFYNLLNTII